MYNDHCEFIGSALDLELHELSTQINSAGGWEEFHQRRGNGFLFGFYKSLRLKLEARWRALKARTP